MRVNNNSAEKPDRIKGDLYFKAFLFSALAAICLIVFLILIGKLFNIVVGYWYWVLAIVLGLLLVKKIFFKRRPKNENIGYKV